MQLFFFFFLHWSAEKDSLMSKWEQFFKKWSKVMNLKYKMCGVCCEIDLTDFDQN